MEDSRFLRLFLVVLMMITVVVVWWKVANYLGSMAASTLSRVVVSNVPTTGSAHAVQLLRDFLQDKGNMDIMMVVDKFAKEGKDPFSPPTIGNNGRKSVSIEKPVMPTIVLRGIVVSGNVRIAVLDIGDKKGVIVKEGENVGEVRVVSIGDGKVVVKWRNERVVLNLE